jgi:hypothetical protein
MNEKRKPIVERLAALMGKTGFRDLREGFGGSIKGLTDQDVAAALGLAQIQTGEIVVKALETFYASTLIHEHDLLRTWDSRNRGLSYEATVLSRFGAALAVRRFAGAAIHYPQAEIAAYAWMIKVRREVLERSIRDVEDWLDSMMEEGKKQLRNALRETWTPPARRSQNVDDLAVA